jgi:hypothetical protein
LFGERRGVSADFGTQFRQLILQTLHTSEALFSDIGGARQVGLQLRGLLR